MATWRVISSFNAPFGKYNLDQHSGPRLSLPPIRFYMFPNLVRRTFQSDNQCNFGETAGSIFPECIVDGDESDMAVTDRYDVERAFSMGLVVVAV